MDGMKAMGATSQLASNLGIFPPSVYIPDVICLRILGLSVVVVVVLGRRCAMVMVWYV